ncbi:MAG: T9SS type A sorting domain-containing protein, partial [Ignavibacteria bacterium]|nr:T9SS type A sorting domain-containing protein [Ignavibacteria bacterium]
INLNETKDIPQIVNLDPLWDADSLNVVVFVQSTGSKTVYQSETISYDELTVSGLVNLEIVPSEFVLEQNYPNPFNPSTKIKYNIPSVIASGTTQSQFVSLKVYDALGNEVVNLVDEEQTVGNYEIEFDATGLSSGIYFYKLQAGSFVETKKMILLK